MSSVLAGLLCFSGEERRLGLVSFSMVNHKILPHTTVLKQPSVHKALSKRRRSVKNTPTHPSHPQTRRTDTHSEAFPDAYVLLSSEHLAGKDIIKSRSRHKLTESARVWIKTKYGHILDLYPSEQAGTTQSGMISSRCKSHRRWTSSAIKLQGVSSNRLGSFWSFTSTRESHKHSWK